MSDFLKNRHRAWQLPDSSEKAESDGSADVKPKTKNAQEEPAFEIDFTGTQNPVQEAPFEIPEVADQPLPLQAIPHQESQGQDEVPSLEVGQPGQFEVQRFDHNTRLTTDTGQSQGTAGSPPIVMLDDPLPSSLTGSPELQDLFVAEVLKSAQAVDASPQATVVAALANAEIPQLASQDQTRVAGGVSSGNEDKTQITNETLVLQSMEPQIGGEDKTIPSYSLPGQPENVFAPPPQAPPASAFAPPPPPNAPPKATESTRVKPEQTQAGGKTKVQKTDKDDKTKSGAANKNATNVAKGKGSSTGKKNEASGETQGQTSADGASMAPLSATNAQTVVRQKNWSKYDRGLMAFVVISLLLAAAAIFKKTTQQANLPQMSTEIPQPSETNKSSKTNANPNGKSPKSNKPGLAAAVQPGQQGLQPAVAKPAAAQSALVDEDDADDGAGDDEDDMLMDTEHLLTRPVSRYAESNPSLVSLIEINMSLERVQPRRVLVQLKNLPVQFGESDSTQKIALRELTARYYMQVGAYEKALILFQQACGDPAKTSDIEVCLHAARAYVLMGNFEQAKELAAALSPRIVGPAAQWREWLRLIENSLALQNPSVESMLRFTDELADKGPFLTTEWSLQFGTLFARTFLDLKSGLRLEFLRNISGTRKKTIEIRLAPKKYGIDIGSYMFPGFLNLMFRNHEFPLMSVSADEPDTESGMSLTSWIFNVIAQARANDLRETKARLAPLFADRGFSALGRLVEGQLAAKAGDYIGAHAMIVEQIGPALLNEGPTAAAKTSVLQTQQFINATQRLKGMPFLFVEWLFLGVKVSAGLNDRDSLKTYLVALEDARRRFPELADELQYWQMVSRAHRVLGQAAGVEMAMTQSSRLAVTPHDRGFVGADKVWLLMKAGKRTEAKALMKQLIREIPHHARLLELAAEYSANWGEEPSTYLRLEAEIPQKYHTRGRDSVLLSMFTIRKLLTFY